MFIIIPLIVLIAALGAILYVSSRKFSYLRKLDTNHVEVGQQEIKNWKGFWLAMFPEIFQSFEKSNVAGHKSSILLEFEKLLRKLRLVSWKMDSFSNNLIHKVRTSHENSLRVQEETKVEVVDSVTATANIEQAINSPMPTADLKKEEQKLIMEIAKDPKNPKLYKLLGDLYLKLEQFDDARESYDSALRLDPEIKGVRRKLESLNKVLSTTLN